MYLKLLFRPDGPHSFFVGTYCRADTESTSEHLEALRKLSSDLVEQRATLEDLRDQRQSILPRLSLLDKELVKQQVELYFCFFSTFLTWFMFLNKLQCRSWVQFYAVFCLSPGGSSGAALGPA